nr:FAD-dependent oxidoreductase [Chromatiaceae bacterium]
MSKGAVLIIGAGMAGLAAAVLLASRGVAVTVIERASRPGGKMRELEVGGRYIDAGPTVFTMRWVFEDLFADAGTRLDAHLKLLPLEIIARHAWDTGGRLDLFADARRSAEAIGDFDGAAEARRYLGFHKAAQNIYETLEQPFI